MASLPISQGADKIITFSNFFDTFGSSPWLFMLLNCKWLWACFSQVLPGIFLLWGHRDLWQLPMCPIYTFFCFISTKFLDTLVIQTRSATYGDTHLIANSFSFSVLKVNYPLASWLSDRWLWQSWETPSSWHLMLEVYDPPLEREWSSHLLRWARCWLASLARGLPLPFFSAVPSLEGMTGSQLATVPASGWYS